MDTKISDFPYALEEDPEYPLWLQVGPKRYYLPKEYKELGPQYYNFQIRPDDIVLLGYPRSGTTWSQEAIWLLNNNLDYEAAKTIVSDRFPLIDIEIFLKNFDIPKNDLTKTEEEALKKLESPINWLATAKSPRFIKSHLPLSLLTPDLLDTAKVVYVARDPRDVAVSMFNFVKLKYKNANIKTFWKKFINGKMIFTPYFEHVNEAWAHRNHPNMLFYTYEDITQDTLGTVRRIAQFCGRRYSEPQLAALCDHLRFDNFRNNPAVNRETTYRALGVVDGGEQSFIRKGKAGGWREYFDEDMGEDAKRWMMRHMEGTDLPFKP